MIVVGGGGNVDNLRPHWRWVLFAFDCVFVPVSAVSPKRVVVVVIEV